MASKRARYEEALSKGHSYSWDQRWQEAVGEFQSAIAAIANEPAAYAGLGMAYFELNELEKALDNYKLAARYSKGDLIYLQQVADVQERLGMLHDAGQTYMAIGEIQLRRKKLNDAMSNWLRAVRLEPNLVGGHQRLATVYQRQGQTRNAIREYLAIARIFALQGKTENALQTCQAALKLDPRNADILTAIELIQHGEELELEEDQAPELGLEVEEKDVTGTIQRMASVLEAERSEWAPAAVEVRSSPSLDAKRLALERLAADLFEDDEEEELLAESTSGLSKLEKDALVSQALDFQTRGKSDEAIRCYERAINGGLQSTSAHFSLGMLYQDSLQLNDAVREFELAAQDEEYRVASRFALGEAYRAAGNIDKAVQNFVDVLRIMDLDAVDGRRANSVAASYEHLSASLLRGEEPERATRFANALVEFMSNADWESRVKSAQSRLASLSTDSQTLTLGNMLLAGSELVLESLHLSQQLASKKFYSSAIEEAYRAIQLSPDYLPAHLQLAELLIRQERLDVAVVKLVIVGDTYRTRNDIGGATAAYERALEISPLDLETRQRLIDLLLKHDQVGRALEHYVAMGQSYYSLAQVDRARETYQEALKIAQSKSADTEWRLRLLRLSADIDLQRFDWKRALSAYSELHAANHDDEQVALTVIDLYYKLKRPDNALRTLDRFLIHLVKGGQSAKVVSTLEELAEQRPTDEGVVMRLARLYAQQRRLEDAVNLLDQLGETQLEAGETTKAVATIELILKLNPPNAASYRQLLGRLKGGGG